MSQELDLGSIAISINLVAEQLEQTADRAVTKLNAIGEQGLASQQKINPLSASLNQVGKSIDNVKFEKLTNKLGDLNTKFSAQQNLAVKLGAELDEMASSYIALEKAAGRSGDIDVSKVFPVQSAELDKEIAKLDELKQQIKITTQERQAAAEAAVQAAQKQAQAADQAVQKQQQLNQKLADKTATNSTKLGMDAAAMSIRGVSSAAGGTVGNLGYLATEVMFLKRTMASGASSAATFAAALSFGVMAAVTLVTSAIQIFQKQQEKLKKAEEERQRIFDEGVRNLQQYGQEVEVLSRNLNTLKDATSTTAQLTSARSELAGTFSDLIVGYTDEGEAILASSQAIEEYQVRLKELNRINRQSVINSGSNSSKDYHEKQKEIDELIANIEHYQTEIDRINSGNIQSGDVDIGFYNQSLSKFTAELTNAQLELFELDGKVNQYFKAATQEGLIFTDTLSGLDKGWDDLDSTQKTVANSFILNVQDEYLNGIITVEEAVQQLNELLSDPAAVEKYFNKLTASLESDKAAAALEELNQKINNQISSLGDLKSAYSALSGGQQLSLDQLYELAQAYPEVAKYIAETGDLTLRKGEILADVYNAERETFLAEQQMRLDQIKQSRESLNATLIEAKGKIEAYKAVAAATGVMNVSDYVYWETVAAQADKSLDAINEQINEINALITSTNGIDITSGGGSSSYRNEALQEELRLLDHKKRMDQITYEQELAWLEKIQATLVKNDEERRDMEYRIFALKKSHTDKEVSALDDLGKAVTDALKAQYDAQRKAEESRISESIKAWKNWEDSTVSAIQGQIDALNDLEKQQNSQEAAAEYSRKTQDLKLQLAYENDDYQRKQIEKQLNALEADEQKRLRQDAIEAEKSALQAEISAAKEKSASQQELLKSELDSLNEYYDERTKSASLQAEAERIIMDNNQQEIVSLIRSYAPDYASAGETLGSRMVEAFKKKVADIVSYVEDITDRINDYTGSVAAVANSAADNFIAKTTGNQATTTNKSSTVNQTVNINQPVTSPVQAARELAEVSKSLARQITGG